MKRLLFLSFVLCFACAKKDSAVLHDFTKVEIEILRSDSISVRAIEVKNNTLFYAGDKGNYGFISKNGDVNQVKKDTLPFRSIAAIRDAYFIMSIGNPAMLYKVDKKTGSRKLVYEENHEKVFYDAMTFWNDNEGIAMGDPTENCMSILLTADGGEHWDKIPCQDLPKTEDGEAAFAASDTNVKVLGNNVWIISGGKQSRVFHSKDKGKSWDVASTPILQGEATQGAYTMDFYDALNGIVYGGDYLKPENSKDNIAITTDGGITWNLVESNANQGYKSCVQYVPNSGGKELIAMGFKGVSYSKNSGKTWTELSKESFLSFRFLNDSVAFAGGRNRLAKLTFY